MKKIVWFLILININIFGFTDACYQKFRKYNIDPNIRSILGWNRVCSHNLLNIYTNKPISPTDEKYICKQCFGIMNTQIGATLGGVK